MIYYLSPKEIHKIYFYLRFELEKESFCPATFFRKDTFL